MGIKERRDIEKTEMKRRIINAAIEIIEQEGYEKLSLRKIAANIEYSPTTIYLYYKDKAEIIQDMSDLLYEKVMRDIIPVISCNTASSAEEQTYQVLFLFIKGLCSEPEMVKAIMFSGQNVIFANDSSIDGRPSNSGLDMLDHLISDGIAENVFKSEIRSSAWMIVSALLGFVMTSLSNQLNQNESFDLFIKDFIHILMGGMKQ